MRLLVTSDSLLAPKVVESEEECFRWAWKALGKAFGAVSRPTHNPFVGSVTSGGLAKIAGRGGE